MGIKVTVTYENCAPINDLWSWVVQYVKLCGGKLCGVGRNDLLGGTLQVGNDPAVEIFTKFSETLERHLQGAFDEGRKYEKNLKL